MNDLKSDEKALVLTGSDEIYSRSLIKNDGTSIAIAAIAASIAIAILTALARPTADSKSPARLGKRYATEKPAIYVNEM